MGRGIRAAGPIAAVVTVALSVASCGRSSAPQKGTNVVASSSSGAAIARAPLADSASPLPFAPDDLWLRAKEGDEEDLVLLATREGASGLRDALSSLELRGTAIRAAASSDGFFALPWLAEVAGSGGDAEAALAVESALALAARPRTAVDPEDALEIREGYDAFERLAALPKDKLLPERQVNVARLLRMMADRGVAAAPGAGTTGLRPKPDGAAPAALPVATPSAR